jgi:diguanylate cyclase (GGDEF)-like protein
MRDTEKLLHNGKANINIRRERLLDVIASIGKVIAVSGNLQAVMDVVAEECAGLTYADGATIFMMENERLSAKAAIGILGFVLLELPLGNSFPSHAVKLKRAVRCDDAESDIRTYRRVSSQLGTRSSVSAPLVFGERNEVAGVLHVVSKSPGWFTEEDVETIEIFADVVGSAIQNALQFDHAVRMSREDALTGLLNRRAFEEHLRILKKEQHDHEQPYSVILLDVDRLKAINDDYGHPAGDKALKTIAQCVRSQVRKSDIVYRLGGDEFAVLLPQTTFDAAAEIVKRIESAVSENLVRGRPLSISSGTCQALLNESVPLLITRADQLLYQAKRQHTQITERGMAMGSNQGRAH